MIILETYLVVLIRVNPHYSWFTVFLTEAPGIRPLHLSSTLGDGIAAASSINFNSQFLNMIYVRYTATSSMNVKSQFWNIMYVWWAADGFKVPSSNLKYSMICCIQLHNFNDTMQKNTVLKSMPKVRPPTNVSAAVCTSKTYVCYSLLIGRRVTTEKDCTADFSSW